MLACAGVEEVAVFPNKDVVAGALGVVPVVPVAEGAKLNDGAAGGLLSCACPKEKDGAVEGAADGALTLEEPNPPNDGAVDPKAGVVDPIGALDEDDAAVPNVPDPNAPGADVPVPVTLAPPNPEVDVPKAGALVAVDVPNVGAAVLPNMGVVDVVVVPKFGFVAALKVGVVVADEPNALGALAVDVVPKTLGFVEPNTLGVAVLVPNALGVEVLVPNALGAVVVAPNALGAF